MPELERLFLKIQWGYNNARLYQNLNYPIPEHRYRQQSIQRVINKLADGVTQYADWNNRDDIKSTMKVYKEVFAQAENFRSIRVLSEMW